MQHDDLIRKTALPVLEIDSLLLPPQGLTAVAWVDLSERPDLTVLASGHPGDVGIAECDWHAYHLEQRETNVYLRLVAHNNAHTTLVLSFRLPGFYHHLKSITQHRLLWMVPGPRPDALMVTHSDNHLLLEDQIIAAHGPGIMMGFHPVLAQHLETLLRTWRQAQQPSDQSEEIPQEQFLTALCRAAYDADLRKQQPGRAFDKADPQERFYYEEMMAAVMAAMVQFSVDHPDHQPYWKSPGSTA